MKLLIDMNLSPKWVDWLSQTVLHRCIGPRLVLETRWIPPSWNTLEVDHSFVLTNDLDFGSILAATNSASPSVIQILAVDVSPEGIGREVVRALRQMSDDLSRGALMTIDPKRTRLTILPLPPRK